jgi:hypothetical protein
MGVLGYKQREKTKWKLSVVLTFVALVVLFSFIWFVLVPLLLIRISSVGVKSSWLVPVVLAMFKVKCVHNDN